MEILFGRTTLQGKPYLFCEIPIVEGFDYKKGGPLKMTVTSHSGEAFVEIERMRKVKKDRMRFYYKEAEPVDLQEFNRLMLATEEFVYLDPPETLTEPRTDTNEGSNG